MAITLADFNKIWSSTSPLSPYTFSDDNYNEGWNFIGQIPPSRQMWDFLQKNNDEKMQYLANNYLPLSGGTMTGDITVSSTDWKIKCNVDDNSLNFWAGSNWSKGAYMSLHGINHAQYPGWFRLYARDSSTSVELRGKPDGTLTWNGQNILAASNYNSYALPLSGGTLTGNIAINGKTIHFIDSADPAVTGSGGWIGGVGSGLRIAAENYGLSQAGGRIELRGRNYAINPGMFEIHAQDSTNDKALQGKPDGTLTWGGQPLLPVGIVQAFAGTTIPNGWLLCDGSAVSRTTYANLYACIGDTYGSGDGSTTFNVPNLIDKFVEGSATAGTEKSAGLPNITGSFPLELVNPSNSASGAFNLAKGSQNNRGISGGTYTWGTVSIDASRSSSIYGNSTTVQPPAVTMKYIIKY